MKVIQTQVLLAIHITDLVDMEDLTVLVEAGAASLYPAQLIVRASARTWNAPLFCGEDDPVAYLSRMSEARLRDALEFSRPFGHRDAQQVRTMTLDLGRVIPAAVRAYIERPQAAPATAAGGSAP
ncbi:hypothetical protein [Pantoea sp. 18069]|uniref:hypothetical protein n=1 Tax=Pantoea sp. 18069 TaxID=2681415 RepID=UPI001359B32F|nr:hypothetical protein [Pantoea sp. 18069]